MGYENKISRLLANSDEKIHQSLMKLWKTNQEEYRKLEKEFQDELLEIKEYTREKFINLIEKGIFAKSWKKLSVEKKTEILNTIEPVLLYEKDFSDCMEKATNIKFVFLETDEKLIIYCNGMYAPMSDNEKRHNEHLRFALRAPYITIKGNKELEEYAEKNEKFPIWLNELPFLKPHLEGFWEEETKKKKLK